MNFGLKPRDYELLKTLLIEPFKKSQARVWIFGSRARGDHKTYSDIDILFDDSQNPIPQSFIYESKSSLEDSNLTVKVDLVNLKDLAESYKESVFRDRVEV